MIDVTRLIADFEACMGWPYACPGSNDERGIDCSGMFVRAYRRQGRRIYHGSNTIWRKHLADKGEIASASDLRPGMAVFKWQAKTPSKFSDDEGDFHHIGLVTQVKPLRIVHASSAAGKVIADTKLGKWSHWGVLAETADEFAQAESAAEETPAGNYPTVRRGDRNEGVKLLQRALRAIEYDLKIDGIFGPVTLECVKTFQATAGLVRDGIVGPLTWAALEKACKEVDFHF